MPSGRRLFTVYAAVTAVPVITLGVLLTTMITRQANSSGLAEGRSQAAQVAQTAISPLLSGDDLSSGLSTVERASLNRAVSLGVADGGILRLRLRTLAGRVIFSDDGSALGSGADDEVLDAAAGHVVATLTRLNADANDEGPAGPRVVEVYEPLLAPGTGRRIGVLELYVPYEPIARTIASDRRAFTLALSGGLAALWVTLSLVTLSVTRRLRRESSRNAHLAGYDSLTELPNRLTFVEHVRRSVAAATAQQATAIAILDLDRFKEINDTLGHDNGDELLVLLGARLKNELREGDLVARLGGDEFGIVLGDVHGPGEAVEILTRLRGVLSEVVQLDGLPISVESSIGFALAPADGIDVETLQQRADLAMYAAKRGHLGVAHYRREHEQCDATTLALVGAMRAAIDHGELLLHYQPKSDARTGVVTGLEALVRWNHPVRGLLFPDMFLPAVEQTELIEPLTRWVLKTAAAALPKIDDSGQLSMAVNVSARSLVRHDFAEDVLAVLAEAQADPARIVLEITETALLTDPVRARDNLRRLTSAGIRISIDDFGAGQTSLGYLATLPISELKIDKSFVLTMIEDGRNAAIVRSVIDLGHSLGFAVTAEGVESTQALQALVAANCDTVQGYLLSRPIDGAALQAQLNRDRTADSAAARRDAQRSLSSAAIAASG